MFYIFRSNYSYVFFFKFEYVFKIFEKSNFLEKVNLASTTAPLGIEPQTRHFRICMKGLFGKILGQSNYCTLVVGCFFIHVTVV